MSDISYFEKIYVQILKYIPNNNYLNFLLMSLRLIPLILITHDWNIHLHYSVTYYLSYLTFLPIIHTINSQNITLIIILVLFIYSIINIFIIIKYFKQIKEFNKISNSKLFKFLIQMMYWVNYIFAPYNFMICVENYFCSPIYDENVSYKLIKKSNNNCRNLKNIIIMIIQSILIIYIFLLNIFFSCIISKPCCLTSSIIVTKLNEVKLQLFVLPLFQAVLVFDYYLPLKICILIKGVIRGIYIIYFLYFIFNESKNFYTCYKFRLITLFIDSMCFVSCIFEFIFLFDLKNNMEILQKNGTIIIFKLIIEIILSFSIVQMVCFNEKKIILQIFDGETSNKLSYELLNKIYYIFNHPEIILGSDILYEIIEYFDTTFKYHKNENKCIKYSEVECYCSKYTYADFVKQSEYYLDIINKIRNGVKYNYNILKTNFPIMYKYLEYFIKMQFNKNKNNYNTDYYLLILAFFYISFDKNYNKGLLFIEEFSTTKTYNLNRLIKLQCKLIKLIVLENYKNNLFNQDNENNSMNSFKEIYKIYSKTLEVNLIENLLSNVLNVYIESLNCYKEKDCSFYEFKRLMKKLKKALKKMNKTLVKMFISNIITLYHLCAKLTIFYSFFYLELPKNINKCFKSIFEITFQYDTFSTMIVNTINCKNLWKFKIEYFSDNLCSKLGYNINELRNKEVNKLTPDSLKKYYDYNTLETIRNGNIKIILREYIFLTKQKHALIFDLVGIIIFDGNKIQLFLKIYDYNFNQLINSNNSKKNEKNKIQRNENNNTEECFAFVNKNGYIFAISKEFEEYFGLSLHTIKKYKINLFKEILKIENIENRDMIKKNLAQIYENIASLNFNIMQNSSNEEFTKIYKKIKEYQTQILGCVNSNLVCMIKKREVTRKNKKIYYFFYFTIEINNNYTNFESLLKHKNTNQYFLFSSNTKIGFFMDETNKKNEKKLSKFKINKNQNETLIKIRQIQILSIKYLIMNYNIKIHQLLDLTLKEEQEFNEYNDIVERETNRLMSSYSVPSNTYFNTNKNNKEESIDNINKFFRIRQIDEPYTLKKKKNYNYLLKIQIYFLILIWILFTILFIILQIYIILISNNQSEKVLILTDILINSLITRNILYSFITSLLRMQYVVNGLHNETVFDNGFTNTISYHKNKIYDRVRDFLYYFKIFERQEKYLCDYNEIEIINLFFEKLDYINVKSENLTTKHSLNTILSSSHLHAYQVIESELEPFLFNISYYTIENRELLGESAFFQFVFDNYFCNGKYTWDEIDNLIFHHIKTKTSTKLNIIYLISIVNGILVCGIFIIQSFFYFKLNDQIYARYYINYNYLQFFNSLLLKKVSLIKDFINNTDIENLYKFNNEKITYENMIEDNNLFKQNYIRINNKIPIEIKPYKINIYIPNNNLKIGVNKINTFEIEKNNINLIKKGMNKKILDNSNSFSQINIEKRKFNNAPKMSFKRKIEKDKRDSHLLSINNTTNQTLIPESNIENPFNLLQELNQNHLKKDLGKPKHISAYLIFFFISITFLTTFFILNDLIIKKMLNKRILYTYVIKSIIEIVINSQEILNVYAITILKGDVITFNYTSHGYLNSFEELDYINYITEHNIMEEVISKSKLSLSKTLGLIEENVNLFQSFGIYLFYSDSPSSCDFCTNYYYENKDTFDYSFLNAFNYDPNELIQQCKNISYGVNLNGITSGCTNLVNYVITLYYEFKEDNKKSENLLSRVNNEKFIGLWTEIDLIYDKITINLIISWKMDLNKVENKYDLLNYFVFSLIIAFICFLFVVYMIFFPIKTLNENEIITQVEPCLYNTIMF